MCGPTLWAFYYFGKINFSIKNKNTQILRKVLKLQSRQIAGGGSTYLQSQKSEHGQRERREDDDVAQVLDGVDDGADDGLEAGDDGHGLERPEHAERPEGREGPQVDGDGHVGHPDDGEVQPVPRVAEVREFVQEEAAGEQLDAGLVSIDGSKYHFGRGGVSRRGREKERLFRKRCLSGGGVSQLELALQSPKVVSFDYPDGDSQH